MSDSYFKDFSFRYTSVRNDKTKRHFDRREKSHQGQ